MKFKRLVVGTVIGGVAIYILGYVIWDLIFAGFFSDNRTELADAVMRESQIIWAIGLASLSYAALLTLAIEGRPGNPTVVDGLKVGAIVGFLLWCTVDFTIYGFDDLSTLTATIADSLLEGVRGAIAGAVIASTRKLAG